MEKKSQQSRWWKFAGVGGEFAAAGAERIGRLYFPIANESGIRFLGDAHFQGGPASSHNEYLGLPLTAEDLRTRSRTAGSGLRKRGGRRFLCRRSLRMAFALISMAADRRSMRDRAGSA